MGPFLFGNDDFHSRQTPISHTILALSLAKLDLGLKYFFFEFANYFHAQDALHTNLDWT
jgi:hypothetical protein